LRAADAALLDPCDKHRDEGERAFAKPNYATVVYLASERPRRCEGRYGLGLVIMRDELGRGSPNRTRFPRERMILKKLPQKYPTAKRAAREPPFDPDGSPVLRLSPCHIMSVPPVQRA